jgi:transcriptional regulator with GAF, ATPase, and Fis domain
VTKERNPESLGLLSDLELLQLMQVVRLQAAEIVAEMHARIGDRKKDTPTVEGAMRTVMKEHAIKVLEKNNWNRTIAAEELGITPKTLRGYISKMRKSGRVMHDPY